MATLASSKRAIPAKIRTKQPDPPEDEPEEPESEEEVKTEEDCRDDGELDLPEVCELEDEERDRDPTLEPAPR